MNTHYYIVDLFSLQLIFFIIADLISIKCTLIWKTKSIQEDKKHTGFILVALMYFVVFFNFTIKWRKEALFWGDEVNG